MGRKKDLAELYEQYRQDLAYLFEGFGTNFVEGKGDRKHPRAIVVGEAPGEQEDKLGEPFIGKSGQFLFKQLVEVANLDREDVWTTNVVKYRPPGNRTPTPDEITACTPYLGREMAIVGEHQPPVLLCGSVALSLLGLSGGVGKWQGQYMGMYKRTGWMFYITWHPAYVLRRGLDSQAGKEFRQVLEMVGEVGNGASH